MGLLASVCIFYKAYLPLKHRGFFSTLLEQAVLQKNPAGITCLYAGWTHLETVSSILEGCLVCNLSAFCDSPQHAIAAISQSPPLSYNAHFVVASIPYSQNFKSTQRLNIIGEPTLRCYLRGCPPLV